MISQMIVKSNIFDKINDYMSIDMIKLDTAWNTSIVACVRTNTMPCSRERAETGPAGQLRPRTPRDCGRLPYASPRRHATISDSSSTLSSPDYFILCTVSPFTSVLRTRCSAIAERPRCRVRYSFPQK